MLKKIKSLIQDQRLCVLATAYENRPYCSLMLYAPDDACRKIYMATQKDTKKYHNLSTNPSVSLLIDTRKSISEKGNPETHALTITGIFKEIKTVEEKNSVRHRLIQRHPANQTFLQDPSIELFSIKVESFLLLEGLTNAHVVKLNEEKA